MGERDKSLRKMPNNMCGCWHLWSGASPLPACGMDSGTPVRRTECGQERMALLAGEPADRLTS